MIYYSSRTLNVVQQNYTTTKKRIFSRSVRVREVSYLLGSKTIVFTDHSTLRYLMTKKDTKAWLIRWNFLLQEFYLEIREKKGVENVVADYLPEFLTPLLRKIPIDEDFPDEYILAIFKQPWYLLNG